MSFLSDEDQFKEILNNEEISRIQNPKIREIRERYWALQRDIFLNERDIPDSKLFAVSDELRRKEQVELQRYKDENNNVGG